jgi:hypothetical protein
VPRKIPTQCYKVTNYVRAYGSLNLTVGNVHSGETHLIHIINFEQLHALMIFDCMLQEELPKKCRQKQHTTMITTIVTTSMTHLHYVKAC